MSGTKILIIVLVLVAVLFVVIVVWGAGTNRQTGSASTFHAESYPAIGSLGSLFGPPGPKLKASELTPNPPPLKRLHGTTSAGKFILSAGDQPTKFDIAADSKDQFRQATFTVNKQGCATIEYSTADGSGGKLKDQPWPGSDGKSVDPKNPNQAKFQVLSAKGRLVFTLQSDCTVQLE
jgi:hypothetical protein